MRLAFWGFLFAFLFLFLFLKSPVYACEPTSNPPRILNCYEFTCASTSQKTWAGEVEYRYPDRSTCTQSEWFTDDTCTTNRTNFSCPMSCASSTSSSGCGQGLDCVAGAKCLNSGINADIYCADPTSTANCSASTLWCQSITCVAPPPPSCSVSWSFSNSNPPPNSTVNVTVTGTATSNWTGASYSLDGSPSWISAGSGPPFNFSVSSDSAGPHPLRFSINNGSTICGDQNSQTFITQAPIF